MDGEVSKAFPAHHGQARHDVQTRRRKSSASNAEVGAPQGLGRARRRRRRARRSKPTSCSSSIGRRPYTEGLGLDKVGLKTDNKGRIPSTNTTRPQRRGIYAIGDVIKARCSRTRPKTKPSPAPKSSRAKPGHVNYDAVPAVVYTGPEVATVGKTRRGTEGRRRRLQNRQVPLQPPTAAPEDQSRRRKDS